jgi:hypothetical protein
MPQAGALFAGRIRKLKKEKQPGLAAFLAAKKVL